MVGAHSHWSLTDLSRSETDEKPAQPSLLLVVKWGGQLTQTGKTQAEALGKVRSS